MDSYKLRTLLKSYEGPKLDFKEVFSIDTDFEKKEFVKDVCAIANTKGGRGYLIYGIKDKTKEVVGCNKYDIQDEKVQQIITNRTDPPVQIRIENVPYEGKNLIVVTIFNSDTKPHQLKQNGSFYIRRGSTTDIARRDELASLMQEHGLISYETMLMGNLDLTMLRWDYIDEYLYKFRDFNTQNKDMLLEALGIIKRDLKGENYHPTVGGMLLFGKNVQTFLPHTAIRIYHRDEAYYVKGTIFEMLSESEKIYSRILGSSYPVRAVDIALGNAIAHRDYTDIHRSIVIKIKEDKVEVINPGAILNNEKIERIIDLDIKIRRNPWLYERLLLLDTKEVFLRNAAGISLIRNFFEKSDDVRFINTYRYNSFKVVLPR